MHYTYLSVVRVLCIVKYNVRLLETYVTSCIYSAHRMNVSVSTFVQHVSKEINYNLSIIVSLQHLVSLI